MAPWLADAFEPRWDIDAAADNVIPLDQHVAEVDADAIGFASPSTSPRCANCRALGQNVDKWIESDTSHLWNAPKR